ncbi:MAG: glutathione S-transferase family protein [Xanthobacteraceae bacterium]|jgi:glutathione S-transferase
MIDLYHHGSSVCAAKVRFALGEKSLAWEGHYLEIHKGDQFAPEYLKLNPKAVVPTLVHDGRVIIESTVINEYLDDAFPEVPLKPNDPQARAAMRVWTKGVDEDLHPACADVTFSACLRHVVKRLPPKEYEKFLASTPSQSFTPGWHERKKQLVTLGFEAPGLAEKYRLYDSYLGKMEKTLVHQSWLAGDTFSLADISMTPYVNRLDMLGMPQMWEKTRPHVTAWFKRIKARPAFKPAFLDWCPPDLTADLLNFGRQSWPNVERLLAQAS